MITESEPIHNTHIRAAVKALTMAKANPSYASSLSGTGPVEAFEETFAKATGGRYALALSSCTAAIHVSLMASGIGAGDEVIVSPYTWGQSVSPVLFTGATVVFADIDRNTLNIDPKSVENRLSSKTKAILPVHLFGNPADMDTLISIAQKNGLTIIADAAQAYGALSKGNKIGRLGDAVCFSLGRGKAVFGGEGGVMVTNNRSFYERAVAISQHPLRVFKDILEDTDWSCSDELNWNYRIHPLAAVLALTDLKLADKRVEYRKLRLKEVHRQVQSIPGIEPVVGYPGNESAAYNVPLTFDSSKTNGITRESFVESLQSRRLSVQVGPIRVPIHLRPTFLNQKSGCCEVSSHYTHQRGKCPVAEFRCEFEELVTI